MTDPARTGNLLLDRLPAADVRPLLDSLRREDLPVRRELFGEDERVARVYFPTRGIISLVVHLREGVEIETVTIGREGMAGMDAFLGRRMMANSRAFGQIAGEVLAIDTRTFLDAAGRSPALRSMLLRYAAAMMAQMSQSAACNGRHHVVERCARWLLQAHDGAMADEFVLTQEYLATMLAVRRPSVTEAANSLRDAGLITYRRGKVNILDRAGLEDTSCECYADIRSNYDRLMAEPA